MTYEQFNQFCGAFAGTSYVQQWGGAHVWKVGGVAGGENSNRAAPGVAGKVFAIGGWQQDDKVAFTFKTSEADFSLLQSVPGFRPAPYMASRGMSWIQIHDIDIVPDEEIKRNISESYRIVAAGLTKKLQRDLGLL